MQPASCFVQRAGRIPGERCFAPRGLTPQPRGAFDPQPGESYSDVIIRIARE